MSALTRRRLLIGLSTVAVSPLSIPYVLDRYVPQLAAAVDGGGPKTEVPAVTD